MSAETVGQRPDTARSIATLGLHPFGQESQDDPARVPALSLSAGFVFDDFDQAADRFSGADLGHSYTRVSNPSIDDAERRIAALENGSEAILVASGQAATTTALLSLLTTGDHIVASSRLYQGTAELLRENFLRWGIEVSFVANPSDITEWERASTARTRVLFTESIANPSNDFTDVATLATLAHSLGAALVVDNTVATPALLRPLDHGADVVVHSASKYLAGHGSVLGGAVVYAAETESARLIDRLPHLQHPVRSLHGASFAQVHGTRAIAQFARSSIVVRTGPIISPFNAFLIRQGLETLALRVEHQSRSALAVATWLEEQPTVMRVSYLGLRSHPDHDVAKRYLGRGHSAVFSFDLRGGRDQAREFYNALSLITRMTHIGDVRTLALHPATTTHALLTNSEREAVGITEGTIRLSIGLEVVEDLLNDLTQALDAAESTRASSRLVTVAA